MDTIRISGIVEESIVDGPGLRLVVFTQGCKHNCKGCHNPDTHSYTGGKLIRIDEILKQIKENPLLDGVTFSGGEPFDQAEKLEILAKKIKEYNSDLNIIVYTGYYHEDLLKKENCVGLLNIIDTLIDGPYEEDKRSLELKFRGSSNQRIIELREHF